jgi:hypothetical protein
MTQDKKEIPDFRLPRGQTERTPEECDKQISIGQQDTANFVTYASTELGLVMKYPHGWIVNQNDILNRYKVIFIPPTRGVYVAIGIMENITPKVLARIRASGNKTPSNIRLLEGDYKHYSLSGYRADRLVQIQSYDGPGQPHEVKSVVYGALVGTNYYYTVGYVVTPPEIFTRYLRTAQSMIDSFQVLNRQRVQ